MQNVSLCQARKILTDVLSRIYFVKLPEIAISEACSCLAPVFTCKSVCVICIHE